MDAAIYKKLDEISRSLATLTTDMEVLKQKLQDHVTHSNESTTTNRWWIGIFCTVIPFIVAVCGTLATNAIH